MLINRGAVLADRVQQAMQAVDRKYPDYVARTLWARNQGTDGSIFHMPQTVSTLLEAIRESGREWEDTEGALILVPPAQSISCVVADIGGMVGIGKLDSLPLDLKLALHPAHEGQVQEFYPVLEGRRVESTLVTSFILEVQADGTEMLSTLFPGLPVCFEPVRERKYTLSDGIEFFPYTNALLPVSELLHMGLRYYKIKPIGPTATFTPRVKPTAPEGTDDEEREPSSGRYGTRRPDLITV